MTPRASTSFRRTPVWLGTALLLTTAAACSSAASQPTAQSAVTPRVPAVTIGTVSGIGKVLVDSTGATLYTNNRDTAARIACTASCQVFWHPLIAAAGEKLASTPTVALALGVRPGSSDQRQVTFHGKPLYTFVVDHHAGQASGNGFSDMFGSTRFTWLAATPSGSARPAAPATRSTPSHPQY